MKIEAKRLKAISKTYDPTNDFDKYLIEYGSKEILRGTKKESVLELGCSTGVMTGILVKNFKKVTVLDGAKKYLDIVRKKYGKKIKCHHALVEHFVPQEKFDYIIAAHFFEHVQAPAKQMARIKKWLKPNGILHIIVPNANSLNRLIGTSLGMIKKPNELTARDKNVGHRRVYYKKRLLDDIKKAGLKIASVRGIYLKPFSNAQMMHFDKKLIRAFYEVGKIVPVELCNELYVRCKR